jgi:hypothetical protein
LKLSTTEPSSFASNAQGIKSDHTPESVLRDGLDVINIIEQGVESLGIDSGRRKGLWDRQIAA